MFGADRPYRTVRELVHAHVGMPAVVLGGGPSLPESLATCPGRGNAVYLSANEHGALFTECDYIVAHDKIEPKIRPFGKPLISRHMWADFRIMGSIVASTGVETAWVARLMGCSPIYIVGMDCYGDGGTYHHDPNATSYGYKLERGEHLRRWKTTLELYPGDYRAIGDPLQASMRDWHCIFPGVVDRQRLIDEAAGVMVRFKETADINGRRFPAASEAELPYRQAVGVVKRGQAVHI